MPQHLHHGNAWLTVAPGMPPHAGLPGPTDGAPFDRARVLALLIHGRGSTAEDILTLADDLDVSDAAWVAPQAAGREWYPFSFLSPLKVNEPGLSSAMSVLDGLLTEAERFGFPPERIVLIGFSQGACLVLEFAARHAKRFGGVVGFSGGLIGPNGTPRDYPGSLADTPVFLGCSDRDPHIPAERVRETAAVMERMGATVDMRLYENIPHTINDDEITAARVVLNGVTDH